MVPFKTNVDYEVRISEYAQSWLSVVDTRAEMREDVLVFSVAENTGSYMRTAVVDLVNGCGEVLQSLEIMQKQHPLSKHIQFADPYVKNVCVEKFDTNGDGELSYLEASKVTSIDSDFFGDYRNNVKSFDEFQHFVSVTTIENSAFYGCSNLTSIIIPDGVTSIESNTFDGCSNLTSITLPESIASIKSYAFYECSSLANVTIPEYVTSIDEYAFSYCSSLESIVIPDGVTSIKYGSFSYCSNLTNITIPNSVIAIDERAFYACSSLASIIIPESVTSIGDKAFFYCRNLKSVYCKATTPPALGGDTVFDNNASDRKIYVPMESVDAYKTAKYWSEYADAIVGYNF